MNLKSFLAPCAAALSLLATPATSFADHKVTVYRDRDHDGHYNKKTYEVSNHGHGSYYGHGSNYGNHSYYGNRGRYGSPYYGYRPSSYGGSPHGYYEGSGYYGYPRTSIGVSIFSRPSYSSYSSYDRGDSLAVDVQSALKRRGYYHGSVDGAIGYGSRSAIRAYQRDHGLATTGRIDSALLRSLRIG